MKFTDIPARIGVPFADSAGGAYIRTIPVTTADPAAASYDAGFPPQCFESVVSGGTPPAGKDFNGILNIMSAWDRWTGAGTPVTFDSGFATNAGGYPLHARLLSTDGVTVWVSTADDNTTDPDGGSPANWVNSAWLDNAARVGIIEMAAYGIADTVTALVCDGRSLLRAGTYARLFARIGTTWGSADGTHFNIPDLRSRFTQGIDNPGTAAGAKGSNDPWVLGTAYADQFQGHTFNVNVNQADGSGTFVADSDGTSTERQAALGSLITDGVNGAPRAGLTTHPRGVGVVYVVNF